ncbi:MULTISPECIES: 7-carboxy-7-deazaguanine synthase [Sphingomonas]|jgi:7-carboxy-7-deazaguanine synthase (Cx14CxxC type)|uniref:7-carboxy-7-deazaguanine synthase n=1 Tax=Sphingomonas hankookensis TaxID=563996 RepID=A0ABR5YF37_9SPHN|nr:MULTISPECIES: 7-carboxy-7-deazaguanine synthase [Sphingomonas]KZE17904.1 7-carboxy-7-deazaguanine synthase [Sphingomonas hankookensis]PZT96537.1 MAG: 7-carboxy-7-deazaguanine synthase [Sphingomonas sp.]WCP71180.1 7-carboxy-7-deazaguanine synthase [Sphingomonas hankookensis]
MTYSVKEMFLTLQGEGVHAGRRAVFVRFAGCNLWTGREADRATAVCRFCDTDFVGTDGIGGGKFADAAALVAAVEDQWGSDRMRRFVVLTGGEPMLQIDDALVAALHDAGFMIAIESNGTIAAHPGIDWICISPKAGSEVVQRHGDELKLVWPQHGIDVDAVEQWDFAHHLVQPMDAIGMEVAHREAAVDFAMARPKWRLSLQTHKLLGLR